MKVVRLLDQEETRALSDLLNQMILRELVLSEHSVTELAKMLDFPTLKIWRRMQKLESLHLIGVSGTQKSRNIETKLYRAAATSFVPQQFLDFEPKDARLNEAFVIYSHIQKRFRALISKSNEIPEGADPIDYSIRTSMQAFVQVYGEAETREKISELDRMLAKSERPVSVPSG